MSLLLQIMQPGPLQCIYLFELLFFVFFGYMPKSEIAGSYGNSVYSFLRKHYIVFHSGHTSLLSHQQCMRGPLSPPTTFLLTVIEV